MKTLKKVLKFRVVALISTLIISYLFTGSLYTSLGLTAVQQTTNTTIDYIMEKRENYK